MESYYEERTGERILGSLLAISAIRKKMLESYYLPTLVRSPSVRCFSHPFIDKNHPQGMGGEGVGEEILTEI